MCDPITAAMTISAGASIVRGIGGYQTAKANAAALENAAQQRLEKGKYDAEIAGRRFVRNEGTVKAAIGTTGTDITSFSDVLADDAAESALEKKAIKVGAEVEANNLKFQAGGQRAAGQMALVNGALGAAGAVAKGFGQQAQMAAINAKNAGAGGVSLNSPWQTTTEWE